MRHRGPDFDETHGSHASCHSGILKITMFGPRWEQQLPCKHFNNPSYLTYCWGGDKMNLQAHIQSSISTNLSPGPVVCNIFDLPVF